MRWYVGNPRAGCPITGNCLGHPRPCINIERQLMINPSRIQQSHQCESIQIKPSNIPNINGLSISISPSAHQDLLLDEMAKVRYRYARRVVGKTPDMGDAQQKSLLSIGWFCEILLVVCFMEAHNSKTCLGNVSWCIALSCSITIITDESSPRCLPS